MCPVQFGHLDGLQYVIGPVQVAAHPVNSKALSDGDAAVKYLSGRKRAFYEGEKKKVKHVVASAANC